MFDGNGSPPPRTTDHIGHKANFDVNEQKLHSKGLPSLWDEISTWLILGGIIAVIYLLFRIF
ncbi:hypothetical protein C2I18_26230 [Paenibacillus sp. PK3_47]|nr:hypothetical protein C2I18_26230 [Paenibacillus sp. PK3_47]